MKQVSGNSLVMKDLPEISYIYYEEIHSMLNHDAMFHAKADLLLWKPLFCGQQVTIMVLYIKF